ncbi:FkbM family methyltransferase [Amycolatopsis regifaucium]|uniref:Non-ribosomal peptide synthetase n=1 Tax=Amycolatopsis regifaucium TaxID=546365 RepID=A0A154MWM9_9PSEU|nr:FkbM family methyltransferase [Amycolatopsis regifaucium]KZB88343.1 non-ribosomal peptide synthetase [Amycolatopsis regifaucium]OKA11454.1 non-ribosomal peptide synthetase [Amycolatopsis regifaucium]SFH41397.1 methyltransferase, FkbM family [Amycolatopsis regifaucium]
MTAEPARDAIGTYELPNGVRVSCADETEARILWAEIDGDTPYAEAIAGVGADEVVLDVGAHIGLASLCFTERAPASRIIAFEPAAATFSCLERNFAEHVPNGTALKLAVAAKNGEQEFVYHPYVSSKSTLHTDETDEDLNLEAYLDNAGFDEQARPLVREMHNVRTIETVEVVTLSSVLDEHRIERVGLLKIDVERAELEVLEGLREDLWPRIRRVLAEVHDREGRLGAVVAKLAGHGYDVRVRQAPAFAGGSVYIVLATRDQDS